MMAMLVFIGPSFGATGVAWAQQPRLVADINPTENTEYGSTGRLAAFGELVCFSGNDGSHGEELWCSDGTKAGTEMIEDIRPGSASSEPRQLIDADGTLFFVADDGEHGPELWRSDGTAAGTEMVKDICPDQFMIDGPGWLTSIDGALFFNANDGKHGREAWRSDGTAAGTEMVMDIWTGDASSNPAQFVAFDGSIFFSAGEFEHGYELWRTDGTAAGSEMVKDIYPGESSRYPGGAGSDPWDLTVANGLLFFVAEDGEHGYELWRSDGTAAGTAMVKDIALGAERSGAGELTKVGETVMFVVGYDAARVFELWRSDGTEAGTQLVKAPGWFTASSFTGISETLFFTASTTSSYLGGLWHSDGTAEGTVLVRSISPGIPGAGEPFASIGSTVFFVAYDEHGRELWRSDGTEAGTEMTGEIYPGSASNPFPHSFTPVGDTLFFVADDGVHGSDALWALDAEDAQVPIDSPPTAIDDEAALTEDVAPTAIDVLVNDTNSDGGPMAIASVIQPDHGTVEIALEGAGLVYRPDADYCNDPPGEETDDFEYTLTPGGSSAKVAVAVACVDEDDLSPPRLEEADSKAVAPMFVPLRPATPPVLPAPASTGGVSREEPGRATPMLLDRRIRVTRQRAAVALSCAQQARCRGRVWIFPRRSVAQTSKLRAAIVRGRYAISGGGARVVWLRLTAAGRQMSHHRRVIGGRLVMAGPDNHGRQLTAVRLQFARSHR